MKLRTLIYFLIILNFVYAQHNSKTYQIDKVTDQAKSIVLWTEKTATEAQKIRLVSKPSDNAHSSYSNLQTQKDFSLSSSTRLNKSGYDFRINGPSFHSAVKAFIQHAKSDDMMEKKIFNAEGNLVGDYTFSQNEYSVMYSSGFPDGRLLRYSASTRFYEMMVSNSTPPVQLTNDFDRPSGPGDGWYGMNVYYNENTQDIFVKTGVIHKGSIAALVFVVDKNNQVLWERTVDGGRPYLRYSPSGNLFTLLQRGREGDDLMVINRKGETVLDMQNIKCSPGIQFISTDDQYLITIDDKIEMFVYDLSDGKLVKQVKGGGGRNMLNVDFAAQTEELFLLKRRLEKDKTIVELVILDVNKPDEKYFKGQEIVSFAGYMKPRGKISVSDDGRNISVVINNKYYVLSQIDD